VNIDQLLAQIAQKRPDLVEFRLDRLDNLTAVETIGQKKTLPAIATDKAIREPSVSRKILLAAASSSFEYVDIDFASHDAKRLVEECRATGTKVIVSSHNFNGTPSQSELRDVFNSVREMEADICKIVTTATHPRDNLEVLNFVQEKCTEAKLVSFAMGSLGTPSRILSPVFGAEFTFAAFSQDSRTADGQLSIEDLRSVWHLLGIQ